MATDVLADSGYLNMITNEVMKLFKVFLQLRPLGYMWRIRMGGFCIDE